MCDYIQLLEIWPRRGKKQKNRLMSSQVDDQMKHMYRCFSDDFNMVYDETDSEGWKIERQHH